ncbi:hypothetical protein ACFPVT_08925 [Corynebacterium choanae]|uniref:YbjN domain-containing protein n=1 Tax=Corynebacterium choanae TaxID=1862358 RepID=A0A3G6J5M0_9CORY|nr:hypothetical protein [Corynebacterium choanae]AZA13391.1 hypothetical protein CCHOA_04915 [Corynebacterium choanae]
MTQAAQPTDNLDTLRTICTDAGLQVTTGEDNYLQVTLRDGVDCRIIPGEIITIQRILPDEFPAADYVALAVVMNNANANLHTPHLALGTDQRELTTLLRDDHGRLTLTVSWHIPAAASPAQLLATLDHITTLHPAITQFATDVTNQLATDTADTTTAVATFAAAAAANPMPAAHPTTDQLPVTRERICTWFATRGITDLPFDPATNTFALSFDGTPIDIHLQPHTLAMVIAAPIPATSEPDLTAVMHTTATATSQHPATLTALNDQQHGWRLLASMQLHHGGVATDTQLTTMLRQLIVQPAAQLKAALAHLREHH